MRNQFRRPVSRILASFRSTYRRGARFHHRLTAGPWARNMATKDLGPDRRQRQRVVVSSASVLLLLLHGVTGTILPCVANLSSGSICNNWAMLRVQRYEKECPEEEGTR